MKASSHDRGSATRWGALVLVLLAAVSVLGACDRLPSGSHRNPPGPPALEARAPGGSWSGPIAVVVGPTGLQLEIPTRPPRNLFGGYRIRTRTKEHGGRFAFESAARADAAAPLQLTFRSPDALQLTLVVTPDRDGLHIDGYVTNERTEPVWIDHVDPLCILDGWSAPTDTLLMLEDSGSNQHSVVKPIDGPGQSSLYTVIHERRSGRSLLAGFLSSAQSENLILVSARGSVMEGLLFQSRFLGRLEPAGKRALDPVYLAWGFDPLSLLEGYGSQVRGALASAPSDVPLAGFLTWYAFGVDVDESRILEAARSAGEFFDGYPQPMRRIMLIDHGWTPGAGFGQWREVDRRRFSLGMPELVHRLQALGLETGLWCAPLLVSKEDVAFESQKESVAFEMGLPMALDLDIWSGPARRCYILDTARPEVRERLTEDMRVMNSWGVSLWKADFVRIRTSEGTQPAWPPARLRREWWQAMRAGIDRDDLLMASTCPTNATLGWTDLMTVPADVGRAGQWPRNLPSYRKCLAAMGASWFKHRTFWTNDHQSIQMGDGCKDGEARIRATAVALSGAGVWMGEDPDRLPPDRWEMLRRCLPITGVAARPLDLFRPDGPASVPRVWRLAGAPAGSAGRPTLALFNLRNTTATEVVDPAWLGIDPGTDYLGREWWTGTWHPPGQGPWIVTIPPFDVAVLHAAPIADRPRLLDTDLHYAADFILRQEEWDPTTRTLRGVLETKAGLVGVVTGSRPAGFRVIAPAGGGAGPRETEGGWTLPIRTSATSTPFEVRFQ